MTDLATGAAPAAADTAAIADVQTAETPSSSPMERITQTMSDAYDKINPPRDNGKFAAKDPQAQPEEGAETAADPLKAKTEIKDQNPAEAATEPPKTAAIDPPLSWSAEKKALWPTLPPDAQSYIAHREGEAHKRISELGQQVKAVEPIRNVVEHYQDTFRRNGIDPADGIARMLNVEAMLERDPAGTIREIAKAYGVDLASAATGENDGDKSAYVRQLEARLDKAERLAGETHSRVTARERSEQEHARATLASLVEQFSKGKADFADIEGDIVAHISAIQKTEPGLEPEKVLEKAYESARWANPNTRARLLAEQEKQRSDKAAEEQKKKATEAKKIGSLNVKSTSASPAKKGSWEETLREVGERIAG